MSSRTPRPRPARRRASAALLAIGALLTAPGAAAAAPGAIVELADVGDRAIHLASTFTSESLVVTNASTAGETIVALAIDLSDGPAMFPDLVFDPAGTGGDTQAKDLTLDSAVGTVALAAPPAYGTPVGGGFATMTATFPVDVEPDDAPGDFDAGAVARFSFDVDPTSIQGTPPEPVPAAAPVSGAELHGATVAVTFSDGTTLAGDLVLTPGTDNSSRLVLSPGAPLARPALARPGGRSAPAVTFDPSQEIVVTGPAGASGVLVVAEGHLNTVDAPGGGFDLEPFEANTAAAIAEAPFTIGTGGTASVEVTLSDTPGQLPLLPLESGINHVTAYLVDGERTGPVSDPLVLRLDPDAERVPPAVVDVFPVDGRTGVSVQPSPSPFVIFSEPMDPGTVLQPGALTLSDAEGRPVQASFVTDDEHRSFGLIPAARLVFETRYTMAVAPTVADAVGNLLPQAVSWSFTTERDPSHGDPICPSSRPECFPAPTSSPPPVCAAVPERPVPARGRAPRLTAGQLRVDQRIAQAALRRAAAIDAWLAAGIRTGDLCGTAFGPGEFAGLAFAGGGPFAPAAPAPRPLAIAPAPAPGARLALTAAQLRVNQRIAQAALRRANALTARLDGGLTGGDIADGAIGAGQLWNGLVPLSSTPATRVPATTTATLRPAAGARGRVTLSDRQARINRRIALAAMRRVNALADRLARGLTGADFRDGSLGVADLVVELRPGP